MPTKVLNPTIAHVLDGRIGELLLSGRILINVGKIAEIRAGRPATYPEAARREALLRGYAGNPHPYIALSRYLAKFASVSQRR